MMTILTKFTGKFQRESNLLVQKKKKKRVIISCYACDRGSIIVPHWKTSPFKRHPYADDRLPEMIVRISPQQTLLKYDLMTLCLVTFVLLNKETRFAPLFPGEFNSNDGQF